ncbi:hypothetical protein EYC84_006758 [Monilinia fructicola]|nr:hypothetical protein EYC84_006758 [Monilinia fructicola]
MRPRSSLFLFPFFYTCNLTALLPSLLASLLPLARLIAVEICLRSFALMPWSSFSYSGLYPKKLKSLDSLFLHRSIVTCAGSITNVFIHYFDLQTGFFLLGYIHFIVMYCPYVLCYSLCDDDHLPYKH